MAKRFACLVAGLVLTGVPAHALTVLTAGKQAVFRTGSAFVRVGRDRALAALEDPTCPSGLASTLLVSAYLQATARVAAGPVVPLPCANWRRTRAGFVYQDSAGVARRIVYARDKLQIQLGGAGYAFPGGPVGYVEVWLNVGTTRLLTRLHAFRKNDATQLVTRKPSNAAAAGEAAFWDVILGDDDSETRQQAALASLARAARRSRNDGWSRFLTAMMHLYRFGVLTPDFAHVSDDAKHEIRLADDAFAAAVPLLWDGRAGDSRVPGFAAAARFARGIAEGDDARAAAGLADLDAALAVNAFFNVFDLIPVIQAVPRSDPRFQPAADHLLAYLGDPETLACVTAQPEICNNQGLAPRNLNGSTLLFGDVYAKAGDATGARNWYSLAAVLSDASYQFKQLVDARLADVDARVARYLDTDPTNDDPIVGSGPETCATCHHR